MPAECLRTEVLWLLPWRCPGAGRPPRRMKMAGQRPAPWHGDVFCCIESVAERPPEREVLRLLLFCWFGAGWWTGEHIEELVNIYNTVPEVPPKESSWEIPIFVHFYDGHGVTVNLRPEHRVEDILNLACKELFLST
ncbi:unnamed protein product [Ranitomeya imitator]|uniref:FERM domain-containing protein n=1 Tax=Ranitomeya imitator TaxID=111125 RepID=A0ABN9L116_9NEOB|nr:unnamed protein product [Ranitomeya imitator]